MLQGDRSTSSARLPKARKDCDFAISCPECSLPNKSAECIRRRHTVRRLDESRRHSACVIAGLAGHRDRLWRGHRCPVRLLSWISCWHQSVPKYGHTLCSCRPSADRRFCRSVPKRENDRSGFCLGSCAFRRGRSRRSGQERSFSDSMGRSSRRRSSLQGSQASRSSLKSQAARPELRS